MTVRKLLSQTRSLSYWFPSGNRLCGIVVHTSPTRKRVTCIASCIAVLCAISANTMSAEEVTFNRDVAPILATHCYECHGPDEERREAGLRLDQREPATGELDSGEVAIVPGHALKSELIRRITSEDDQRMPPYDAGRALNKTEIENLRTWIDAGAEWQGHWAFEPLDSGVPSPATTRSMTRIDQYIESAMAAKGLRPAEEAGRYVQIRRLFFDVVGLPPTIEQIRSFVRDQQPNAYERLVDELLASPAYGERWGRHWLDVARYGDSNGGDENHAYPLAHRYRDYVIDAFNEDLSFDHFVTQQLAGDLLPKSADDRLNAQQLTATGYLAIGMKILAEQDPVKKQADMVDEQIDTLGRTFLGLSLGCARCHDHKFDPIPTKDYYALAGILHSSSVGDKPLMTRAFEQKVEDYEQRLAEQQRKIEAFRSEQEQLSCSNGIQREAESFDRGNVAVDSENYGKGIGIISDPGGQQNFAEYDIRVPDAAEYVLLLRYAAEKARPGQILLNGKIAKENAIDKVTGGWNPDAQVWMNEGKLRLREGTNVLRIQSEPMMSHIDKVLLLRSDSPRIAYFQQLNELMKRAKELQEKMPEPSKVMAMSDGETKNVKIHVRGSHLDLGEEVPRGFLSVLDGQESMPSDQSGRLQLAKWLTENDAAQRLTSRVLANRIWLWHFGTGLVKTPDDFGIRGASPTHPQLLDYLASQLIGSGWSIKKLHRQILLSRVYRMKSLANSNSDQADPANDLLSFRNRLRLDAESIRDALLSQSRELQHMTSNAPMIVKSQDPSPEDMAANLEKYEASRRRSVYLPVVRSNVYEFLTLFDFPNASTPVGKRNETTIPTQALWMMNSPFVVEHAEKIAHQFVSYPDSEDAIAELYLTLFAREPTQQETAKGQHFLAKMTSATSKEQAWTIYCQTLIASNEYVYLR